MQFFPLWNSHSISWAIKTMISLWPLDIWWALGHLITKSLPSTFEKIENLSWTGLRLSRVLSILLFLNKKLAYSNALLYLYPINLLTSKYCHADKAASASPHSRTVLIFDTIAFQSGMSKFIIPFRSISSFILTAETLIEIELICAIALIIALLYGFKSKVWKVMPFSIWAKFCAFV